MKIEKGIPLPPRCHAGKGRPYTDLGKTMRALEVGDSFLVETEGEADRARYIGTYIGFKVARRKMGDGWRIWRME